MEHKDVIKAIDGFVFEGKELDKEVELHILSCSKCRVYFENSKRFVSGIEKLKKVKKVFDLKKSVDSYTSRFSWIQKEIKKRWLRRIIISFLGGLIIVFSVITFLYYYNSSYISDELTMELMLMEDYVSYIYSFDEVDVGY